MRYGGPDHHDVTEEEEKRWDAATDADGRLSFTYPLAGEGQCHVAFFARDSWRQEIQGNAVFWVSGPQFDGRAYRYNDLEIIADKRSYRVGETAHLLVNTAADNARLLFADRAQGGVLMKYRFLDVPGRSTVLDVPIDESCVPNTFAKATFVRDGIVHTEVCELDVPPESRLLNAQIRTDKPSYGPGETSTVHAEVTDNTGKPAAGTLTLTAFDQALTYIEPEAAVRPRAFFHGERKTHELNFNSSFGRVMSVAGKIDEPQVCGRLKRRPEGWGRRVGCR